MQDRRISIVAPISGFATLETSKDLKKKLFSIFLLNLQYVQRCWKIKEGFISSGMNM
jgi:hypothetical protein